MDGLIRYRSVKAAIAATKRLANRGQLHDDGVEIYSVTAGAWVALTAEAEADIKRYAATGGAQLAAKVFNGGRVEMFERAAA